MCFEGKTLPVSYLHAYPPFSNPYLQNLSIVHIGSKEANVLNITSLNGVNIKIKDQLPEA